MGKKIMEIFETTLDKKIVNADLGVEFREFEEWDSLAYLSVIAEIDNCFGIVIPIEEFRNLRTIADIVKYLESHKE